MRVETSKGEAWPGQQEINFRFADALTMADNHVDLQERRQGDRLPATAARSRSWRSRSRTGSATRATSTRRCWRDGAPCFASDETLFARLARRADRVLRGARDLPRTDDQLVQAVRRRLVGADDARVGQRQPHLRLPRRRPRRGAPRGDADPGRRRQPVPRVRRRDRRRAARDRARARAAARRSRGTRTSRTRTVPVDDARGDRGSRERRRWRAPPSATRSSTTTSTTRAPSRGCTTAFVTDWERKRYFERG